MTLSYRPEIDGLRAVAVLPVILFHAGFSRFSGGFVGVDVFFVISGFLITSILLADLESGRFSIRTFYERRARRILPALFVVMAACIPAAWLLLPYADLVEFGESVLSVTVFASNVYFWLNTGYFETASELKPLLHTWSLAVEEQYYIAAPVLLWLLWKHAKPALAAVLAILALVSLTLAEHGARVAPEAAFFLPHTRVWELTLGALAAITVMWWGGVRRSQALSLVGLSMIASAIVLYDQTTPFPGVSALLPTVGTVLVLVFAGPGTLVNRVLATRVCVGVGLVSYSAYLWHQPLFAFARHMSIAEPEPPVMLALSALTLLLAYLSWRFVEQPFRRPGLVSRRAIFRLSGAGLAVSAAAGLFIMHSDASRTRQTLGGADFLALSEALRPNRGLHDSACTEFTTASTCTSGTEPVAVLWGDSYAMHLAQALRDSPTSLPFVQMTKSACAPILGVAANAPGYNAEWGKTCIRHNDQVFEWLAAQPGIRYVILASVFGHLNENSHLTIADGSVQRPSGSIGEEQFIRTIDRIRRMGKLVIIVSPTPAAGFNVGRCLTIMSILGQKPDRCHFQLRGHARAALYERLIRISERTGAGLVLLSDLMCEEGLCLSTRDGAMIYRDGGHLSAQGSSVLGRTKDLAGRVLNAAR